MTLSYRLTLAILLLPFCLWHGEETLAAMDEASAALKADKGASQAQGHAQDDATDNKQATGAGPSSGRPLVDGRSVKAVKLEKAPTIDGRLDPGEWSRAAKLSPLHQTRPGIGVAPTMKTDIWIAYDNDYVYVGARLYDNEPAKIVHNRMLVDTGLFGDDRFVFQLSPFNNSRNGFRFETNPNGVRRDSLIEGPSSNNSNWDTIWDTAASIDGQGWVAEMRIPFKSLNFDPNNSVWGITFQRSVARTGEQMAWTSFNGNADVQSMGTWVGVKDARQGVGLDVIPGLTLLRTDPDQGDSDFSIEPTLEAFYRITPSLTGVLTLNTDFSTADVDDQVVNLSRFSVFFPERRDFFLQDNDIFSFGGLGGNGNPFFSRRIGLDQDNAPVNLKIGGKIAGRIGDYNVGILDVVQEAGSGDGSNANLLVARVSKNILANSQIGAIVTHGDPISGDGSLTYGVDALYRSLTLVEGREVIGRAYWLKSDRADREEDDATTFGFSGRLRAREGIEGGFSFTQIGEDYDPALGFVNRGGIRRYSADTGYAIRPPDGFFRRIQFDANYSETTDMDGNTDSREFLLRPLFLQNQPGDEIRVTLRAQRERLVEPFEIVEGVIIPVGTYDWERIDIFHDSASVRRVGWSAFYSRGGFFTGNRQILNGNLRFSPSKHFTVRFGYDSTDVDLPEGGFISRIFNIRMDVAFDSRWSWITRIQYDNVSDSGGMNSRLRFNRSAGQDFFLVVNQGIERNSVFDELGQRNTRVRLTDTGMAVRLLYTLRF